MCKHILVLLERVRVDEGMLLNGNKLTNASVSNRPHGTGSRSNRVVTKSTSISSIA